MISAIGGLNGVYRSKMEVVPINEMVPIFRTSWNKGQPKTDQWARLRRAEYKGMCALALYCSATYSPEAPHPHSPTAPQPHSPTAGRSHTTHSAPPWTPPFKKIGANHLEEGC